MDLLVLHGKVGYGHEIFVPRLGVPGEGTLQPHVNGLVLFWWRY